MISLHGHADHAAQTQNFLDKHIKVYVPHKDLSWFGDNIPQGTLDPQEGDKFNLGNTVLTSYAVPGHTVGSLVLLDAKMDRTSPIPQALTILGPNSALTMWAWECSMDRYYTALVDLKHKLNGRAKRIFTGHNPLPLDIKYLDNLIATVKDALDRGESALVPSIRPPESTYGSTTMFGFGDYWVDPGTVWPLTPNTSTQKMPWKVPRRSSKAIWDPRPESTRKYKQRQSVPGSGPGSSRTCRGRGRPATIRQRRPVGLGSNGLPAEGRKRVEDKLAAYRKELVGIVERQVKENSWIQTAVPSLYFVRQYVTTEPEALFQKPSLCIILQGRKEIGLAEERFQYGPSDYLVSAVGLPVTGQILEATREEPYISLKLEFTLDQLVELLPAVPGEKPQKKQDRAIYVSPLELPLLDAMARLVRLVDTPENIPVLAPLYTKEILYYLLLGPQGDCLRQFALKDSKAYQIQEIVQHIIAHYNECLSGWRNWRKSQGQCAHPAPAVQGSYRHESPLQFQ